MEIIGLSGFARSGKDTAADILVEEFGFIRVAFADKLRDVLYQLNPIVNTSPSNYFVNSKEPVLLQDVIDSTSWDGYKETQYGDEIRRLLQRLGTEAGRQTLWDSIWIDAAFAGLPDDAKVVVSDMRFVNEKNAIESRGGKTLRINRPGVGPANNHPSETELTNERFDFYIENDGSLEEFKRKVERFANELNL